MCFSSITQKRKYMRKLVVSLPWQCFYNTWNFTEFFFFLDILQFLPKLPPIITLSLLSHYWEKLKQAEQKCNKLLLELTRWLRGQKYLQHKHSNLSPILGKRPEEEFITSLGYKIRPSFPKNRQKNPRQNNKITFLLDQYIHFSLYYNYILTQIQPLAPDSISL